MILATPATVSHADAVEVYQGSVEGTDAEGSSQFLYRGSNLNELSRFRQAAAADLPGAHAYLLGCAARCAYAVRNVVTGEFGGTPIPAAALGRLKPRGSDTLLRVGPADALAATTVSWSRLARAAPISASSREHAVDACKAATVKAFADHVDAVAFDLLVPPRLYDNLGSIVPQLKHAVANTLRGSLFAPAFADAEAVAVRAENVKFKVAGAPDGWGGLDVPLRNPGFTSSDGALTMLLKQARTLFTSRMLLVKDQRKGACDLPPLFGGTFRNAYILPDQGCSVLLPGILVPPFADADYDTTSLITRIGYVVAHETAHVTVASAVTWIDAVMQQLLTGYAASTLSEALADVVAVGAIVGQLGVDRNATCLAVSQLWCARTWSNAMMLFLEFGTLTHPAANHRGNQVCDFLAKHY